MASASLYGEVLFWDLEQAPLGEPIAALAAHVHAISCVSFSRDGGMLLTASADKSLRVWSVYLSAVHADTQVPGVPNTANGDKHDDVPVEPMSPARSLTTGASGTEAGGEARLRWGLQLRLLARHRLLGHDEAVTAAAFLLHSTVAQGNGKRGQDEREEQSAGGGGGGLVASSSMDGSVRLWNLATGEPLLPVLRPLGRAGSLGCVAWSHDGQLVAGGSDDGSVRVWDLGKVKPAARRAHHAHASTPAEVSPSSRSKAHAVESLVLRARSALDVMTAALKSLGPDSLAQLAHLRLPPASPSSATEGCSSGSGGGWAVTEAQRMHVIDGHRLPLAAVAFSRSDALIVSACAGGLVKLWARRDGALLRTLLRW